MQPPIFKSPIPIAPLVAKKSLLIRSPVPSTPPPPLKYDKPEWSAEPPLSMTTDESVLDQEGFCEHYFLEVIKNGIPIDKIKLNKEYISIGRLDTCDIQAEHPTLSRYHAILQYSNGKHF